MDHLYSILGTFIAGLLGMGIVAFVAIPQLKLKIEAMEKATSDIGVRVKTIEDDRVLYVTVTKCETDRRDCTGERRRDVDGITSTVEGNRKHRQHEIERVYETMATEYRALNATISEFSQQAGQRFEALAGDIGKIKGVLEILKDRK